MKHYQQTIENKQVLSSNSSSRTEFYQTKPILGGKFKIAIPTSFSEMTVAMIATKYPNSSNRPNLVYTNEDATVNIGFTHTKLPTEQNDLAEVKDVLSQQLQSAKPENFSSRLEKINGFDYVIFEFVSQAMDSKIYNLMFATDVDGKLLIGAFNCTKAMQSEWQPRAREILASIQK